MSRSQNRHDTAKWKKKRKTHLAALCDNARCGICHPNKAVQGNHKFRTKPKHRPIKNDEL